MKNMNSLPQVILSKKLELSEKGWKSVILHSISSFDRASMESSFKEL
jgi:hypothetical protein